MMWLLNAAARECWACVHHAAGICDTWCDHGESFEMRQDVKCAPKVNAVSEELFNQIKWERDIAIGQLQEIGCELGQKMDDVKAKLDAAVRRGRWNYIMRSEYDHVISCSACGHNIHFLRKENAMKAKEIYYECPKCRADMRERDEDA